MRTTFKKVLWLLIRIGATVCAFGVAGYLLYRYEYFAAFGEIDNLIGAIPIALLLIFACGITAVFWIGRQRKYLPLTIVLAVIVVLSAALFPLAIRGNWWWFSDVSTGAEAEPDLTVYAPFSDQSLTAKLDEESALQLRESLPVLDGATALYPVYAAFAEAAFDRSAYTSDKVLCSRTTGAYRAIVSGEADIIFVAGASERQKAEAEKAGVNLTFTPIGKEAFVFVVGNRNPVEDISIRQIRNIYSGKTAKWSTLGWREGGDIVAFQRPEGSGSQTGLQNLMGDLPIQAPQPLPDRSLAGTNSLMKQVSVEWKGVQPAIGYSYKYYATTMFANPDAKLLSVEGVYPSSENIRNGSYPFTASFYAVTNGTPQGNTKLLIDWILSRQGQSLIEKTGYTPIIA